MFSTLDNLSDCLVLPVRSNTRLCLIGLPIFASRGLRGGRQADKRPIETSAVVQKVGGVSVSELLFEGSRKTALC